MKTKILILIYTIIIGTVVYFAYPVIKNRYFQASEDAATQEKSNENKKSFFNNDSSDSNSTNDLDDIPDESTLDEDVFIEVDTEDCEDGCEQFEDADDKKYCQQYCGLSTNPATLNDDCEKLADLEKDYCWKNKALTKKDFSFCKKIIDKKLLESCKNQLTEEVLNSSNSPIE